MLQRQKEIKKENKISRICMQSLQTNEPAKKGKRKRKAPFLKTLSPPANAIHDMYLSNRAVNKKIFADPAVIVE
jgi:hypothetical protein